METEGPFDEGAGTQVLDRKFLFVSSGGDSRTQVAWLFRSRPGERAIHREWSAWLARNGTWEPLVHEDGRTALGGTPWRILPGSAVRVVVGEGDQVESLFLRDPPRELETSVGELLTEWSGPRGGSVRLHRGRAVLPVGEEQGFVLDLARVWNDPGAGPGDWLFLHAGNGLQLFLAEELPLASPRSPAEYRGWSRVSLRDGQWPRVDVEWTEVRAFESARRDIPTRWRLSSPGGEITGELEVVSQHLNAGAGEGPLLPVTAFYEVSGSLRVEGQNYRVTGIVSHRQR
jgi:hypothetical protein